jgi:hypothetical protein
MSIFDVTLTDKEKAYINLLNHHLNQFKALLADLAGPAPQDGLIPFTRELALANTRLEEGFLHAREHVLRQASKRNAVN